MNTQPEALRLADALTECYRMNVGGPDLESAAELRRLQAIVDKYENGILNHFADQPAPVAEPVAWMDGYRNIYSLEEKAAGCEDAVIPLVPATLQHWSDCAVHNEPAYPAGKCDCGGYTSPQPAPVAEPHKQQEPVANDRIIECAKRLVEHADFQLGGVLSADSKAKDIPSRAVSQVKSRHLAALRDALANTSLPASKPLTDEEIVKITSDPCLYIRGGDYRIDIARAIEAAHGIKGNA